MNIAVTIGFTEESYRRQWKIAVEALDKIANYDEGPVVTGSFDEPNAARAARAALDAMLAIAEEPDALKVTP